MSGKGVVTILVLLIGIPVVTDLILSVAFPGNQVAGFGMTQLLGIGYLRYIPWYIAYLIVAFAIIYSIKQWKKRQNKKDE